MTDPLAVRVTQLERRLANLERQAGGGEQLSANYLTIDPTTGDVGATFTGIINATGGTFTGVVTADGLILPSSTVTGGAPQSSIEWIKTADGSRVAQIEGFNAQVGQRLLQITAGNTGGASLLAGLSLLVEDPAQGNQASVQANAGSNFVTLIDQAQNSSFVQIGEAAIDAVHAILSWGIVATGTGTIVNAGSGDWSVNAISSGHVQLNIGTTYSFLVGQIFGTYNAASIPTSVAVSSAGINPIISTVDPSGNLGTHNVLFIAVHD
jgi:hypothetical protein